MTAKNLDRLNGLGTRLKEGLDALFAKQSIPARTVCTGSVFSLYFSEEPVASYRALAATDKAPLQPLFFSLLEQGYFLGQPGLGMCSLSLAMDESHIDGLVAAVHKGLAA